MLNKSKIKVIFMGTPEFAVESLMALKDDDYNMVGVFTAPDRPAGRGQEMKFSAVKRLSLAMKMPIFQPEKIRDKKWVKIIKDLKPDLIVVAAFGQIIPESILNIPTYGCINVHASLLPKYRGASPIHFALLNGEKETGVTIMKMDAGMDTGPTIANFQFPISNEDNLQSLHDKLAVAGAELLLETLPKYLAGELKPVAQDEKKATYTKILQKKDGKIDWHKPAAKIADMIRAFCPWPGTFTEWNGKCLKIVEGAVSDKIVDVGKFEVIDNRLYAGTNTTALEIVKLQMEGRKCLIAQDFLRGCSMIDGYYCK